MENLLRLQADDTQLPFDGKFPGRDERLWKSQTAKYPATEMVPLNERISVAGSTILVVSTGTLSHVGHSNIRRKPRRSGAFKSLSLLRGLASGCWLGRLGSGSLRSGSFGVLSDAVVDEVLALHEVDGRILLGSLSFA